MGGIGAFRELGGPARFDERATAFLRNDLIERVFAFVLAARRRLHELLTEFLGKVVLSAGPLEEALALRLFAAALSPQVSSVFRVEMPGAVSPADGLCRRLSSAARRSFAPGHALGPRFCLACGGSPLLLRLHTQRPALLLRARYALLCCPLRLLRRPLPFRRHS